MSHLYTEVLLKIEDPTLPDRAANLLRSSIPAAQKAAVQLLVKNPTPSALDTLWTLRCSLEGDDKRVLFRIEVEAALAACVKLTPDWLVRAIRLSDPAQEPFAALIYLLVQLEEIEGSKLIWSQVRDTVIEKAALQKDMRALIYASEAYRDIAATEAATEILKRTMHTDEDLVAPAAMRALGLLDPERALAALEEGHLESSLRWARSWWLPQLLVFDYRRTSEILLKKIQGHESPWIAAAAYDHRENLITVEILDFLLTVTKDLLDEALTQPESDNRDPLARPFHFLSSVSSLELLARFEALRATPFEEALTSYLIRQGPNDEGWYRWKVWDGIAVLQRIGGKGLTRLANSYLKAAQTRLGIRDGLLLGIRRPDEETLHLVREIANDPERGAQTEERFPLVQYEAVKTLAALGLWREAVQGCLRLGLQVPRSLPDYFDGHIFTDDELVDALEELRSGAPSPGALLMAGFSDRPELASVVRDIYAASDRDSDRSLACLLALESLADRESEDLFLDNLGSKNSWVAVRALLTLRTPRGDEALLARLRHLGTKEGSDQELLAMNLLIRDDTRQRAARILWGALSPSPHQLLFYMGDTVQYLSVLDLPEVWDFLRATALSKESGTWGGAERYAAIEALISLKDDDSAFEAAIALFHSDDEDRLRCPKLLLAIKEELAITVFRQALDRTEDFLMIAAIAEALDRRDPARVLAEWLRDTNARIREAACFAVESLRWSQELEDLTTHLLQDPSWNVRAAARSALDDLALSRKTLRLAQEVALEPELSRRWTLIEAALTIGYPGVVDGYGAHSWFGPMIENQPYPLRKHALSKLEEKRKKLREELTKRERS